MATNNSSNQQYSNEPDGFKLAGGLTKRQLTVTGADVTLTGSGLNTFTMPSSTDTLVGRASTDTLTNKTITAGSNTITGLGIAALGGITGTASSTTYLRGNGTWAAIAQSDVTNLTADLAAKATDSSVVKLTGNQTIAGEKTFSNTLKTKTIDVHNDPGQTARIFLNHSDAGGQAWEIGANEFADFTIYDTAAGRAPFYLDHDAPLYAMGVQVDRNGMNQQLDMNGHKIFNVTNPTNAQDVATKAYVDTAKVSGSVNGTPTGLTLWTGTQSQYDAIVTKDSNTVYIVTA